MNVMQIGAFRFTQLISAASCLRPAKLPSRDIAHVVLVGVLLAGSSALFAQSAQTAYSRLGVPEVHSALGSPLWVKIPVEATDATADIAASSFSLGAKPLNAGIPFLENAEITFERQGARYFLVLRSRQPVDELAIGVIVRERLMNGVRSREFTLLLDPPPLFDARTAVRVADSVQTVTGVVEQAPATALAPSQPQAQSVLNQQTATPPLASATRPPAEKRVRKPVAPLATVRKNTVLQGSGESLSAAAVAPSASANSRANATASQRQPKPNAPLRLSLSTQSLSTLPTASEATRAELRLRQLILDTDDLTSALLERTHRIGLLEKELASLSMRVSATELSLNASRTIAAPDTAATQAAVVSPPTPADAAPVPAPATATQLPEVTKSVPAVAVIAATPPRPLSIWIVLLGGIAALVVAAAAFSLIRRRIEARNASYRIVPEQADDYVTEAPSFKPITDVAVAANSSEKTTVPDTPLPTPVVAEPPFPEIHFELPDAVELPVAVSALDAQAAAQEMPGGGIIFSAPVANPISVTPPEDLRGRRMRYLQSRYQDIAILLPPLDAPQRLLNQAGRIHDEGAAEYAKRLLKYAVYSRPYTEEFWLGLLELLYREKFANDYLVNAKWFRDYHPQSSHWDEIQRIGYLLNPGAPIFASAAAWSHEEPTIGVWLPANQPPAKPVTPRPQLKLELAG